jgi:hypothetical protein
MKANEGPKFINEQKGILKLAQNQPFLTTTTPSRKNGK